MKGLDLFAGAGGWDVAASALGWDVEGVEIMPEARLTRDAAGFKTVCEDVRDCRPRPGDYDIVIASPPCQSFSAAGKGAGRDALDVVLAAIEEFRDTRHHRWPSYEQLTERMGDERTALVLEPLRVVLQAEPTYVAWEQVPPVLPVWEACAEVLRDAGYSVATGLLSSEQYGVPQTRKRAILIARNDGKEAKLPEPTHSKYYSRDPKRLDDGVLPWVSMAEALEWGMTQRPYFTLATAAGGLRGGADEQVGGSGARNALYKEREEGRWLQQSNYSAGGAPGATAAERGLGERVARSRSIDDTAATLTGKGTAYWTNENTYLRNNTSANAAERDVDEPAPTLYFGQRMNGVYWRSTNQANSAIRTMDQPAPTIATGHSTNDRQWVHERPAPTITTTRRSKDGMLVGRQLPEGEGENIGGWGYERPATTVAGDPRIWPPGHKVNSDDVRRLGDGADKYGKRAGGDAVRVTIQEAAVLQSFPADFPFQGTKTKQYLQVGNACPPLLAWHVLRAVTS